MLQLLVRGKINAVRNADDVAIRLTVNMWNNMATNENLVALMLLSIQFLCRLDSHRMWVAGVGWVRVSRVAEGTCCHVELKAIKISPRGKTPKLKPLFKISPRAA